ncbi:MAG TPA: hypothetical protein VGL56_06690 [Fimbriimonadaceae bacterium]
MKLKRRNGLIAGTSLIELLVVIVVFLIGILAIAQIFPGGFKILAATRAETVANGLAHSEMDRIRGFSNNLPEEIVPVTYTMNGSNLVETISDQNPNELGPAGNNIALETAQPAVWGLNYSGAPTTWDVYNGTTDLGPWQLLSGPNNFRHVIGEGGAVPSPRAYNPPPATGSATAPSISGCLLKLQFAPILPLANPPYLPAATTSQPTLSVYGNDLQKSIGPPAGQLYSTAGIIATGVPVVGGDFVVTPYAVPNYDYFWDDSTPAKPFLYVPVNGANVLGQTQPRYRVTFAAQINTTAGVVGRTIIMPSVTMPPTSTAPSTPNATCYCALDMSGGTYLNPGESLVAIDYNSLRVARDFDDITLAYFTGSPVQPFDSTVNADGTPRNPYQYIVVNSSLGLILVNPLAYGYVQQSVGGSAVPLQAKADYDVYDWRILKEDFRLPETAPYSYQLKLTNIKHQFGAEADGTNFAGIPTGNVIPSPAAVVVLDEDTGGVLNSTAFTVNYHTGLLNFNPTGASTISEVFLVPGSSPSPTTPWTTAVNNFTPNATQHTFRVFYMGVNEWATQVTRGAANYVQISTVTPLPGQFYIPPSASVVGPSSTSTCNSLLNINFAKADVGQTVSFDELWYQRTDHSLQCARGQSALVKLVGGVPSVLISDIDPQALGADFSNGYAVRGVKGTSILIKEFYNPNSVTFSKTSGANNLSPFNLWENGWRVISTQAILENGGLQ